MGVSTNAILFYGYCWSEEGVGLFDAPKDVWGEGESWQYVVLRKRGVVNPWDAYPVEEMASIRDYRAKRAAEDAWTAAHRSELDAWYAAGTAVEKEFGCDIHYHCSNDCPMPYIAPEEGRKVVYRGCPEVVTVASLTTYYRWDGMLERFMTELGISKPEGQDAPQWWLASYWG